MLKNAVAIDLGTASILAYRIGKGLILNEPSVVAVNKSTGRVIAVGKTAERMIGRTPPEISAVHPLEGGVIADLTKTEAMIKIFLQATIRKFSTMPTLMMCVPSGINDVEQRAVIDTARELGAKNIYIIEEPVAAAYGAGFDVTANEGCMVVDIGGGTTDIAVISRGKIIAGRSIQIAGDSFTDAVIRYIRKEYNLSIGRTTAETMKAEIGAVKDGNPANTFVAKGQNLLNGLPKSIIVGEEQLSEAFTEIAANIVERVLNVLEETPVRLQADVMKNGIVLTGGGSQIKNLDSLIQAATGVKAFVAEDPVACVAMGAGKALAYADNDEKRFFKKAYLQ